ncbi:RIP metalloprotease RseP [Paenimyroides aestuarii]|uniref:Zinc metalloprotease n=1 Tax=Paenimyroides aestuarii TaxID=2968490 RepID=A0ABY5NW50_9FLAO|nr:RIP metalloprotease RseP [Paenimyroides aestuarii]UUV22652.1 RIP metalloprotease RseP [Paenimyroides aestuarii]
MDILVKLSQFLLSLSLLIVLHELGHFIPAKLFKTRVEKFYLFFDVKFSLFKKKIGETVYGIGWLPLGGYVKIAGMIDESMDTDQLKQEPQPWEFRSKPAWQRLIIMLGGVTVNFILAFMIYIGMTWFYGDKYIANEDLKDGVWVVSDPLLKAGMVSGDKIISIDGERFDRFNEVNEKLTTAKKILVERNGQEKEIVLPVDFINQMIKNKSEQEKGFVLPRVPFIVSAVEDGSINEAVLKPKDFITSINGEEIKFADQVKPILSKYKNQTIPATILRNEKPETIQLKVNANSELNIAYAPMISLENAEKLGLYKLNTDHYSLLESIPIGLEKGKDKLVSYGKQLKMIVNPDTGAYKGVGGFKAIYDVFPNTWSWEYFWSITAFLSIMLGVMNLLPIPALDGGHVLFLLYEMISGRKPSDKFLEYAQTVGFVILIALLLFANGNDIFKAITGK